MILHKFELLLRFLLLLLIGPAAPRKKVPIALSSRRRVGLLDKLLIEVVYGDQWREALAEDLGKRFAGAYPSLEG